MKTALISTVRNEARDLPAFLASIERQTRRPDLVVITSADSGDGTDEILQEFEDTHYGDGFVWLPLGDVGRSFGRNEAVRFAYEEGVEVIACTNVCVLRDDWFEKITDPILYGDGIDLVGGGYHIVVRTNYEDAAALVTQYTPEEATKKRFISALSMAFTAEVWRNVGGFPEDLETSEDTVFVQRVRDTACGIAYVADAVVEWRPATLTLRGAFRTYRQFAVTDRIAGVGRAQYIATTIAYAVPVILPFWLVYRARKALAEGLPSGLLFAAAVDLGRIVGWLAIDKYISWRGKTSGR